MVAALGPALVRGEGWLEFAGGDRLLVEAEVTRESVM
jgi:hypothetical protein